MKLLKLAMLTVCVLVGLFYASNLIGFALTALVISALLSISYFIRYWREGMGVELAYWGLAYSAFGMALLVIAILQSHAGCLFLVGDCYQQSLPSWLADFKVLYYLSLMMLNSCAFIATARNIVKGRS